MTKEQVVFWISKFKDGDIENPVYRKNLVDIFVNSVYLYKGVLVIDYNVKDSAQTVSLVKLEAAKNGGWGENAFNHNNNVGSHLDSNSPPLHCDTCFFGNGYRFDLCGRVRYYESGEIMSTKEYILELLEKNRGQSVSGEYIAKQLDVTRNAVWKAIKDLEKDGYRIEAVTNKGYCLYEDNDILSVQGMLPFLLDKEKADKIQIYGSLESTNKTAKEMASSGAEHGAIIFADSQTAGKGRYGRKFYSPPGHGIYVSFILHPERLWFDTPTIVTAFAAVSVCEAIESITGKEPRIKWVNDIYLDERKICGILTEAVTDFESGSIQWIAVGIGINFSTPSKDLPEDLRRVAGSIFGHDKPSVTRNRLAAEIINRIVTPKRQYDKEEILEKYRKRLMMLGQKVLVNGLLESYEAVAVDIDESGRLIVKRDNGEMLSLSSGEISIRRIDPVQAHK